MGIYPLLNGHISNFDKFLKNEGPKWAYIVIYEDGYFKTKRSVPFLDFRIYSAYIYTAPIAFELGSLASWDTTKHVRNLFRSKIPLQLGDTGDRSWKSGDFSEIPYVNYIGELLGNHGKSKVFQLASPVSPRWSGIFDRNKFLTCLVMSQLAKNRVWRRSELY